MRIWIQQPDYVIVANTFELELKCHNLAAIGATGIRALAMKLTREWLPQEIMIPPMLFTQKMLRDNNTQHFNDLFEKFLKFNTV